MAAKKLGVLMVCLLGWVAAIAIGPTIAPPDSTVRIEGRQQQDGTTCGQYFNTVKDKDVPLACTYGSTCALATGDYGGVGFCSAEGDVPPTTAFTWGALPSGEPCPSGALCCSEDEPSWGIVLLNGENNFALGCGEEPFLFSGSLYPNEYTVVPLSFRVTLPTPTAPSARTTVVSTVIVKSVVQSVGTLSTVRTAYAGSSPASASATQTSTTVSAVSPSPTPSTGPTPIFGEYNLRVVIIASVIFLGSIIVGGTTCFVVYVRRPRMLGQPVGATTKWDKTSTVTGLVAAACGVASLIVAIVGLLKR